jgi:Phage tail baseplate hub (GPD)
MNTIFFNVKINGADVSDLLDNLNINQSDSGANLAHLTFVDSNLVLSETFKEGLSVEIDLGYTDAHAILFRGFITGLQANFPSRGEPQVTIDAAESMIKLRLLRKSRPPWQNKKISQIVAEIAKDNHLKPGKIEPIPDVSIEENRPLQQHGQTDLEFLLKLANQYAAKLYIECGKDGDTLNFVSTKRLLEEDPVEEILAFNANLENFSVSVETAKIFARSREVTTDSQTGERIEITKNLVNVKDAQYELNLGVLTQAGLGIDRISELAQTGATDRAAFYQMEARSIGAPSRPGSDRSNQASIPSDLTSRLGQRGSGQARGSIWLRPYRRVQIDGCGGRWSGNNWYLVSVQHQLDIRQRNYTCSFNCTR